MAISWYALRWLSILLIIGSCLSVTQGTSDENSANFPLLFASRSRCSSAEMCLSQWGYCGTGAEYCGTGCTSGPCWNGQGSGNTGGGSGSGGQSSPCPESNMCMSQWGYCGTGETYCGAGCTGGPCSNGNNGNNGNNGGGNNGNNGDASIITDQLFACIFNTIDDGTRSNRLAGLRTAGWKPSNKDEAAVFLAHVFHETDGLKTIREYCAPGCGSHYAGSWCEVQGVPSKLYYGRGWFQLSWPCNYYAAGRALGVDLLNNPDLVEQQQDLAVKTAIWYYNANNMAGPAQQGDFAATTRIINGPLECNGGPGTNNQMARVATYKRVRQCFGLGEPSRNPVC